MRLTTTLVAMATFLIAIGCAQHRAAAVSISEAEISPADHSSLKVAPTVTNEETTVEESDGDEDPLPTVDEDPFIANDENLTACDGDKRCLAAKEARIERIEQFKIKFLQLLNIQAPPNISRDQLPSEHTVELLKQRYQIDARERLVKRQVDRRKRRNSVSTRHVLLTAKPIPRAERDLGAVGCEFEFSDEERIYHAQSAILYIYAYPDARAIDRVISNVTLETFVRDPAINDTLAAITELKVGPRREVRLKSGKYWASIDVTAFVNRRMLRSKKITMRLTSWQEQLLAVDIPDNSHTKKPYIQVSLVRDPTPRRQRRAAFSPPPRECQPKSPQRGQHCCPFELWITFAKVGWDWILFPQYYNAKYCEGPCGYAYTRNRIYDRLKTFHSIYEMKKSGGEEKKVHQACCVPTDLSQVSVLYVDSEQNVVYTQLQEMMVEECQCM